MSFEYNESEKADLQAIKNALTSIPSFEKKIGMIIRKSLDEVIDGMRTGRVSTDELEKTEKTYIGTKVEIVLRAELELHKGKKLDTNICGHEVDIKWTLTNGSWMIPKECVDEICLLVTADDENSKFSIGLVIAKKELLNEGKNQDSKKTIKAANREYIDWLVENGDLPENLLLHLPEELRNSILNLDSRQSRVTTLFREVQERIIPRVVVETLAQQKDPMRRLRIARECLEKEGILLLGGQEFSHRKIIKDNKLPVLSKGESMSIQISKLR